MGWWRIYLWGKFVCHIPHWLWWQYKIWSTETSQRFKSKYFFVQFGSRMGKLWAKEMANKLSLLKFLRKFHQNPDQSIAFPGLFSHSENVFIYYYSNARWMTDSATWRVITSYRSNLVACNGWKDGNYLLECTIDFRRGELLIVKFVKNPSNINNVQTSYLNFW